MLCDIVRETVQHQSDMTVVGEFGPGAAFQAATKQIGADVVIVGTTTPDDITIPGQLLAVLPRARVLALAVGGRSAVMYELRPHRTELGEVSPQVLVDAIRGATRSHEARRPLF
jgi:DNA-binding NarL/FixJ family response regulator